MNIKWHTRNCVFARINSHEQRKMAAFELHLQGPTKTWLCCLDEDETNDWAMLKEKFKLKYTLLDTRIICVFVNSFAHL